MVMGTEAITATVAPANKSAGSRPLDGKVALVSGAGRGFGRLLSVRLADAGAAVGPGSPRRLGGHGAQHASDDIGGLPDGRIGDVGNPNVAGRLKDRRSHRYGIRVKRMGATIGSPTGETTSATSPSALVTNVIGNSSSNGS